MSAGHGKGSYRNKTFDTPAEADAWAKDERAKIRAGTETPGTGKVATLAPLYVEHVRVRGAKQHHLDQIQRVIDLLAANGATDLRDKAFAVNAMKAIKTHEAKRKGQIEAKTASASYRRKMFAIARGFTKWAADQDHVGKNPLTGERLPKASRSSKDTWEYDEIVRIVSDDARYNLAREWKRTREVLAENGGNKPAAAATLKVNLMTIYNRLKAEQPGEDPVWLAAVLGAYTGARPSEVRSMTWGMVEWNRNRIVLPPEAPGNKTSAERRITIMDELREILIPRIGEPDATIVDPSIAAMKEGVYTRAFQNFCRRIGVAALGPHTLRHCCGALMTAVGTESGNVMNHLGHDDRNVCQRYSASSSKYGENVKSWKATADYHPGMTFHFRLRRINPIPAAALAVPAKAPVPAAG